MIKILVHIVNCRDYDHFINVHILNFTEYDKIIGAYFKILQNTITV